METTTWQDFKNFAKNNKLYLVVSVFYYVLASIMLGATPLSFLAAFFFYLVSLGIVFSSIGESLLRALEHVRRIETRREKDYLLPIWEELYTQARRKDPEIGHIELCIIDKLSVNACALGKHTVAVTKGAMQTFKEDQLKAILAHEIGHIVNHDTIASLYAWVGNGIFTALIVITKAILTVIDFIQDKNKTKGFWRIIVVITKIMFEAVMFALMFLMQAVIAISSRKNEYRADHYVYELGYGEELVDAFYLLEKIHFGDNSTVIQKMIASHPRITSRIAKIEVEMENDKAIQTTPWPLN